MATLRKTFLAAIVKSLLRGKTLIQAILAYCVSPLAIKGDGKGRAGTATRRNVQDFLKEAEALFLGPVSGDGLQELSEGLKKQFLDRLQTSVECMLPSYSHQLPEGTECGRFLALDVGGSTLRVALVELRGRTAEDKQESEIVSMKNFFISPEIKDLEGMAFFDWMAERIKETLETGLQPDHSPGQPIPTALAWSFPIETTSLGGGKLQPMGKGFLAHRGLLGQDLGQIVKLACENHGLNVELRAILNDSSACLLSRSYSHTSTRFGLILGTGVNLAAYLPISAIGRTKFGKRPETWYDEASHVIVNTEMSMFGYDILPWTRWDRQLCAKHSRPDFQPLELLVSGMYLGEIGRYALIEAIETTGVFGGVVPPSLTVPYSLASETLSRVQGDTSADLAEACKLFATRHPSSHIPNTADLTVLKELASYISVRSSALVAACVYAFWDLRIDSQKAYVASIPESSPLRSAAEADIDLEETTVAFNGSVIESYTNYLASCQRYVDDLVGSQGKSSTARGSIRLVPAKESSLLGAAVALACVEATS
ncbi:Fc.00g039260.m01.CDS01 [Cosmosporella sp. VM-42]